MKQLAARNCRPFPFEHFNLQRHRYDLPDEINKNPDALCQQGSSEFWITNGGKAQRGAMSQHLLKQTYNQAEQTVLTIHTHQLEDLVVLQKSSQTRW